MAPSPPTLDVLETVTRRQDVLSTLTDTPQSKRELVDELACSRSTIDRAIRELEWLDLISREDRGYRLTAAGRLALTEHRRSQSVFESISAVSSVLGKIPRDAPMSTALLEGASVSMPPAHAPHEPIQEFGEKLDASDRIRIGTTADRLPQVRNRLHERTVTGKLDAEVLITEDLAEFVRSTYEQQLQEMTNNGGVGIYVVDSLPYEFAIVDLPTSSRVFLYVLDESEITAVIENDSVAAIDWADSVYRRFRGAATELSLEE